MSGIKDKEVAALQSIIEILQPFDLEMRRRVLACTAILLGFENVARSLLEVL